MRGLLCLLSVVCVVSFVVSIKFARKSTEVSIGIANIPSAELNALQDLFDSTDGNNWIWQGVEGRWDFAGDPQPCDPTDLWQGIICGTENNQYYIDELLLSEYNLVGSIPESIGDLSSLTYMDLSANHINGSLPYSLYSMSLIQHLKLGQNLLTGQISSDIGNMIALDILELDNNNITGTMPSTMTKLLKLSVLNLFINDISGTLPSDIGNLRLLTELDISNNHFNGTLPESLCDLTELRFLYPYSNHFTGTIPGNIGNLRNLRQLEISYNNLTGSIPDSVTDLQQLTELMLFSNSLTGSLPSIIGNLKNLTQLELDTNYLNGTIPDSLCQLTNLTLLRLYSNNLSGSLPSCFGNLSHVIQLGISNNRLNGTLPESIGNMIELRLGLFYYNQFTGLIPQSIGNLVHLVELELNNNLLVGQVPDSISQLTQLTTLYLNNNLLSGTIPHQIGNLNKVNVLNLNNNRLNGSIPYSVGGLTSMYWFAVNDNELVGPIPAVMGNMSHIVHFAANNNYLTSSLPANLGSGDCSLFYVDISNNQLTGVLPSTLGNCKSMDLFFVFQNYFSQSLPSEIGNWTQLTFIDGHQNAFTGTLPEEAFCKMKLLTDFTFSQNQLDGPIPCENANFDIMAQFAIQLNDFTGSLPTWNTFDLEEIDLSGNHLSGDNVFDWVTGNPLLYILMLYDNLFSGTLPNDISDFHIMEQLELYNNLFSGSLPTEISKLRVLKEFLVNDNKLTGSLDEVFNVSYQLNISNIDVSTNHLTGTIPEGIWSLPVLSVFAAGVNCLHGSISEKICQCSMLTGLSLDGLLTADSCQTRFFPHNGIHKAYYLSDEISGTLPPCLFELPQIATLHLSGNGIGGSIPNTANVSLTLTDLSLSHNLLTGTIPTQLQQKSWSNLDLSYNRLMGDLLHSFADQSNSTSVSLEVNRLSGVIPAAIKRINDIDVLNGNIFSCNYRRSDLPSHDSDERIYECGSNSLDTAMFVFVAFLGCLVGGGLVLKSTPLPKIKEWIDAWKDETGLESFRNGLELLRKYFTIIAAHCLLFLMPSYIALSHYYNTYTHAYSWIVSAAYLSGTTAAIVLFVFWLEGGVSLTAALLFLVNVGYRNKISLLTNEESDGSRPKFVQIAASATLLLVNALIVTLVNVAYVYVNRTYNATTVVAMQFFVVVFKRVWNGTIVVAVQRFLGLQSNSSYSSAILLSSIVLFNNLVAPFIATAFSSSNCFYNIIETPASVSTSFAVATCVISYTYDTGYDDFCSSYSTTVSQTTYTPPFIYNYQCASTFISTYTDVYVYMFVEMAFLSPLFQVLLNSVLQRNFVTGTLRKWMEGLQWQLLKTYHKAESSDSEKLSPKVHVYFKSDAKASELISALAILLTFGVVFPPLSVVILVAVIVQNVCTEVLMGRILCFYKYDPDVKRLLVEQSGPLLSLFLSSVWIVVPVVTVFYAYLLFDTLGDKVGWKNALWMPLTTISLPLIALIGVKIGQWRRNSAENSEKRVTSDDIKL